MKPEDHWQNLAARFRENPPEPRELESPHGFATRIVALSDIAPSETKPQRPLLVRLRNWSLLTAGLTALAFVALLNSQEPQKQFLPLPELDLPTPAQS